MNTVFGGIESERTRAGVDNEVIVRCQGVLVITGDGETTATGDDDLSFAEESRFAVFGGRGVVCAVTERIGAR